MKSFINLYEKKNPNSKKKKKPTKTSVLLSFSLLHYPLSAGIQCKRPLVPLNGTKEDHIFFCQLPPSHFLSTNFPKNHTWGFKCFSDFTNYNLAIKGLSDLCLFTSLPFPEQKKCKFQPLEPNLGHPKCREAEVECSLKGTIS